MTIQEIARLAEVSISTVSKVMNEKDKDISEATRNKVLKVVEENNYIPYAKYRAKDGLSSKLIGLLIQKSNVYCGQIIAAVEEILQKQGYQLVVSRMEPEMECLEEKLQELRKRGVSGVMIDSSEAFCYKLEEMQLVYFTDTAEFDENQENTFYYRKTEAGRLAASTLLKAGHEKISCILLQQEKNVLKGVRSVYREQNLSDGYITYYLGENLEDIREKALSLCVNDEVTAVLCGNIEITGEVISYAKLTGMKIPHKLSILCMGDAEGLKYMADGITAVRYPVISVVENAVQHLIQMVSKKKDCEITRKFPSEIQIRKSVTSRSSEREANKIVVVGSMNMDLIVKGAQLPVTGETKIASNILTQAGGKGGNQAAGVGKLGGKAYMVGRLGKDADGRILHKSLKECGVQLEGIEFDENEMSGKAFIHIDKDGENAIVVFRGASGNLNEEQMRRHERVFKNAEFCLLSSEISREALVAAIKNCQNNGTKIMLKPSAMDEIDSEILKGIDYLVPNEKEMAQIHIVKGSLEEKATALLKLGVKNVIVTLGKKGSYLKNKEYSMYFPAAPFTVVDSTGGADSFISAMAVSLSEGKDLIYSMIFATYAAGITITKYGVQGALPDKKTVNIYADEIDACYKKQMRERKKKSEKDFGVR